MTSNQLKRMRHQTWDGSVQRTVEQVELATLEYVWWWNNQRLHGELGMRTPIEAERDYYAEHPVPETTRPSLAKN